MFFLKVVNKISDCRKNSCIERELRRNYDDIVKRKQNERQEKSENADKISKDNKIYQ